MALKSSSLLLLLLLVSATALVSGHLSPTFYSSTCPGLRRTVRSAMAEAVRQNPRNAAFLIRLFFHDCFVNGCDGSILLDSTAAFASEKFALPNNNSARGFELVDAIKARVEAICPATVSCADVLALSTQEGVALLGGPTWTVELGRRDSRAAFQTAANKEIPSPFDDLKELVALFRAKGLDARDMTALSGAHTIGQAQCFTYAPRIHEDRNIDGGFAARLRRTCPANGRGGARAPLDSRTPYRFDNAFYQELVAKRGLLHSDQELFNGGSQDKLVRRYSTDAAAFERDFAAAMVKMGALLPRPGTKGEIRRKCNRIN
ncbi:peroxidase P7-like [Zingiber officinale]|uniref:peroxidase P7-like n=1 Tax=Zingiber officinale TaxID=94328 RepID=UPI001C4AE448|nr:peroxidase P7-like [Zingiber officinale]